MVKETVDVAPKEEEESTSSTQDRIQAVRETLDFARECSAQVSQMQHQTSMVTNYSKGSLHHLSLEDRKLAREVRLHRALERVRREKEEAELQKAQEEARRLKDRKEKVYSLYMFYDMPSKKKMYKLATRHGLTKEDVNALPWMKGDKTIDQMAIADIKYAVGKKSSTHNSSWWVSVDMRVFWAFAGCQESNNQIRFWQWIATISLPLSSRELVTLP